MGSIATDIATRSKEERSATTQSRARVGRNSFGMMSVVSLLMVLVVVEVVVIVVVGGEVEVEVRVEEGSCSTSSDGVLWSFGFLNFSKTVLLLVFIAPRSSSLSARRNEVIG